MVRKPVRGVEVVASLLARSAARVPDVQVSTLSVNGAVAVRIGPAGTSDTAFTLFTFAIADGRISRIYGIVNPHKLARLEAPAPLSRG